MRCTFIRLAVMGILVLGLWFSVAVSSSLKAPSASAATRASATQSDLPGTLTFGHSTNTGQLIASFAVASGVSTDIAAGYDPYQAQNGEIIFDDPGGQNLIIRDTSGNQTVVMSSTLTSALTNPVLSPDGALFAYYGRCDECSGQPYGAIIRDRTSRQFVGGFLDFTPEDWTPGGQLLMTGARLHQTPAGIYLSTPDFQGASRVDQNMPGKYPRVSPDGQRIAFEYGNHVWAMQLDGSNPVQITTSAFSESYAAWSPDGHYLLVLYGEPVSGASGAALLVSPDQQTQMPPFTNTGSNGATPCTESLVSPCALASNVDNQVFISGRVSWRSSQAPPTGTATPTPTNGPGGTVTPTPTTGPGGMHVDIPLVLR